MCIFWRGILARLTPLAAARLAGTNAARLLRVPSLTTP